MAFVNLFKSIIALIVTLTLIGFVVYKDVNNKIDACLKKSEAVAESKQDFVFKNCLVTRDFK